MTKEKGKVELLTQNLSSFIQNVKGVERFGTVANIIVDYLEDNEEKPVRLIGFRTSSKLTDSEILEEGYSHIKSLNSYLKHN